MGFGFASFLLGDYSSITQTPAEFTREGSQEWGVFAQDSWKVRRNLTVTYGMRWDYATPEHEQYGRLGQLDPTLPNANAGGALGAVQFASTCNAGYRFRLSFRAWTACGRCLPDHAQDGLARAMGIHLSVCCESSRGPQSARTGVYPLSGDQPLRKRRHSGFNCAAGLARHQSVCLSARGNRRNPRCLGTPMLPDGNESRPPRINQFSSASNRRSRQNFILEASYVGNRAVWLGSGPLGTVDGTGPSTPATGAGCANLRANVCAIWVVSVPRRRDPRATTITRIIC